MADVIPWQRKVNDNAQNRQRQRYFTLSPSVPWRHYISEDVWCDTPSERVEVIDVAVLHESVVAAVRREDKMTGNTGVYALVYETSRLSRDKRATLARHGIDATHVRAGWYETEGPTITKAPRRILELLTPTQNEAARQWRNECWRRIYELEKKDARYQSKTIGDILIFDNPIEFRDGVCRTVILITKDGDKNGVEMRDIEGVCLEDNQRVSLNYLPPRCWKSMRQADVPNQVPKTTTGPLVVCAIPQANEETTFVVLKAEKGIPPAQRVVARNYYRDGLDSDVDRVNREYMEQIISQHWPGETTP